MKSPDPQIRIQAIRASETIYKSGVASLQGTPAARSDKSFADDYRALTRTRSQRRDSGAADAERCTASIGYAGAIESTMAASSVRGIKEIGAQLMKPRGSRGQPAAFADPALAGSLGLPLEQRRMLQRGAAIYTESARVVPRARRQRRTDGGRGRGHDARALARRLGARRRTP